MNEMHFYKGDPMACCLEEIHFTIENTHKLKMKQWTDHIHRNKKANRTSCEHIR